MNARQTAARCTLEEIASLPNLFRAASLARRGKRRRPDVETWWLRRESEILALREELLSGSYQPGPYHTFEIFEPKRRVIAAAPFRDRVVHHALCARLAPVLERRFIARTFSCQPGKGTTAARECCRCLVNRHAFVLKCDVRKFFPNIDHAILFAKLAAWLRDDGALGLIRKILDSHRTGPETPVPLLAGDDLAAAGARARGLPIGNLTSQLWGNFYLDDMDHWVTETQQHGDYLRYTDDFLLFGDDKARLWELRAGLVEQLARVRLKLAEPKSRLLATREGVPFCGFRFLPGLRPRILGATKRRFEARRFRLFRQARPTAMSGQPGAGDRFSLSPAEGERAGVRGQATSETLRPRARLRPDFSRITQAVFAWYQFSREGNSEGLRRAYARWPLDARLKRRRRKTSRVLRGGSWNNDHPDNFRAANRNNNNPENRNDNNGFRCASGGEWGASPKAGPSGAMCGGPPLPRQSQADTSLTAVPAPVGPTGKDAARAVAGNREAIPGESHGPQPLLLDCGGRTK